MTFAAQIAFAAYILVALITAAAALFAKRRHAPRHHSITWLLLSVMFVLLAIARAWSFEDRARQFLRAELRSFVDYADRTAVQAPLVLIVLLGTTFAAWLAWKYWPHNHPSKSERLIRIGQYAGLGFVPLFAMRLISLHAVDTLLYAAPFKLNWAIDGSLTLAVASAAILYVARVRQTMDGPNGTQAPADRR